MKIELLYPEVCCLYGDLMNAEYLSRCIDGAELVRTPLGEKTRMRPFSAPCLSTPRYS